MTRLMVPARAREDGFSIVEILVATFVLIVGILGVLVLLTGALRTTSVNITRVGATNLARELVERTRGLDYDDMTSALVKTRLQARGHRLRLAVDRRAPRRDVHDHRQLVHVRRPGRQARVPRRRRRSARRSPPARPATPTARTSAGRRSPSPGSSARSAALGDAVDARRQPVGRPGPPDRRASRRSRRRSPTNVSSATVVWRTRPRRACAGPSTTAPSSGSSTGSTSFTSDLEHRHVGQRAPPRSSTAPMR